MIRKLLLGAFGAMAAMQPAAAATTITGAAALKEWNLVTFNDLTATSAHVHGRSFIGGSVKGANAADFNMDGTVSSNGQAGLTVVGNVEGSDKKIWKGATIGGSSANALVMNGTAQTVKVGGTMPLVNVNQNTVITHLATTDSTFVPNLQQQRTDLINSMIALSDQLRNLSPTSATASVTIAANTATFNVTGTGLNVIALSSLDLSKFNQINFASNAGTTVINVSGTDILLDDNVLGGMKGLGSSVLWNFYDAKTITLTSAFDGSILAPKAKFTANQDIYGTTIVDSLALTGEIHDMKFNGNLVPPPGAVPEPASWAMMIAGFGLVGGAMRRRRLLPLAA